MSKTRFILALLLGLALIWPVVPALAETDDRPLTAEEEAAFKAELAGFQAELAQYLKSRSRSGMTGAPTMFEGNFSGSGKSSSLSRAFKEAQREVQAGMDAWMNQLGQQGYAPVDPPPPQQDVKTKWGISGFKFYARIKLNLKVWCQKMN
ncbi:MAG: hypothetical protein V1797_00215 [Pseudomonadota bacterium]